MISQLLPAHSRTPNRAQLLQELTTYSQAVLSAARNDGSLVPGDDEIAAALKWLDRPVFVCGHHRSGTTLLQQLLDGHPQAVVLPSEATYFSSFRYVARSDPDSQAIDRFAAEWIARFIDPNHEPHFKLGGSGPHGNPYVDFARRLLGWIAVLQRERPALARFAALLALIGAYRDVAGAASAPILWIEKTPLNEHNALRLSVFPQARFIQVVREPTATFASLAEGYRKAGVLRFNSAQHARAIGRSLRAASTNLQRLGPRYLVVRYEDLTRDVGREMDRIREFLGIAQNPALLTPSEAGKVVGSNSSFGAREAGGRGGEPGVVQPARTVASLSHSDARLVNTLAAPAAWAFGYDVARPSLLTRSAVHLSQLPANVFRLFRALRDA